MTIFVFKILISINMDLIIINSNKYFKLKGGKNLFSHFLTNNCYNYLL